MHITILTLFPEMIHPFFTSSIMKRAIRKGLISYDVIDFRDFADGVHKKADDIPYGGGAGMVIMAEPLSKALDSVNAAGKRVVFPMAGSGIFSSYILAIGRALGETMTVTMLIGNTNQIPDTLRTTGNTMASIIANQFGEADGLKLSSLIAIGLLLFLITAVINMIGKILIRRAQHV